MAVVTNLANIQIGDIISCEYTSISNTFGTFANLGSATKDFIPASSSATPNGSFYFIHTGYDHLGRMKLVADRNLQHSISWDKLNEAGLCGEKEITIDNKDLHMRLLSGGVSSTDKDNEWDKIIAEYNLDETITAGDNTIWNWNGVGSWTSSTPVTGNTYRAIRGNSSVIARRDNQASSVVSATIGFRPVLLVQVGIYLSVVSFTERTYDQNIELVSSVEYIDNDNDIRYRYLVNEIPQSWSSFGSYNSFNLTISYSLLEYGDNDIKIEIEDEEGYKSDVTVNVYRELTSLLQPIKVYFNETTLNWLPILSTEKLDSITLQKTVESFQNISVTGTQYKDSDLQLNTSYTYKLIGVKDGVEIVESNLVSITTPSEAYLYYLWQDDEYVSRVIEGIAFDSADVDYDFYTTPNRIIVKPLALGDLIGGRIGNVFAFEVLNTYETKNLTITLYATDANQATAIPVNNYGEFQDSENPDWRSWVLFDYDSEFTSDGFYPAIFNLTAGQKKVIYCKFKPGVDAGIGQKVMYVIATTREVNFNE